MNNIDNIGNIENINVFLNLTALNLKKNLIKNNNLINENMVEYKKIKTTEDLRLYNLLNIKKFEFEKNIYGMVHVQMKFFIKKNNYDFYIEKISEKVELAFDISKKYSESDKLFVFLDLSNITQKNFSRKFIKIIINKFTKEYDERLALCFLHGSVSFVKVVWPFIKLLLDKDTKKKIVLLK